MPARKMPMAYNTGNPTGSTSPKDLSDNAKNLDLLLLGDDPSYPDRKGVPRKSWNGMEAEHVADQQWRATEFNSAQIDRETQFTNFLESSGYEAPVPYAPDATLERVTQTVTYLGDEYRVKSQFLPLITKDWATDESKLKLIGDNSLRQNIANILNPLLGTGLIGFNIGAQGSAGRTLHNKLAGEHVSIVDFGAVEGGLPGVYSSANSLAVMRALLYVYSKGGGSVLVPTTKNGFRLNYPPFIMDRVRFYGEGPGSKLIFENPTFSRGRGGIVIGSSLEANRNKALAAYNTGTFPDAPTMDLTYENLPFGTFLRDNPSKVETRDACVHDLYLVAEFSSPNGTGGYGINFVNAWNCHVWNIWGEGWTQLIGMGSDVAPETPSNHMCTARDYHVIRPDPYRTYYAMGFQANSTNCFMVDQYLHTPCTETWESIGKEGNGIAANMCEDGGIFGVHVPNLGTGPGWSSAGVYIADCKDFDVDRVYVGNARRAVQTFFFRFPGDPLRPVRIGENITGKNCESVISLGSKYVHVAGFKNVGSEADINLFNGNVSDCVVEKKPEKIAYGGGLLNYEYLDRNKIKGWMPSDIYLRPAAILMNDKIDTSGWDTNKRVAAKAGVKLSFLWEVPPSVTAIRGFTIQATYAGDSTVSMNVVASIRRMAGYNGNTGEAALINQTVTAPGIHTSTADRLLTSPAGVVVNANPVSGLPNSLDLLIEMNAPTVNSAIKEIKVRCYM